MDDYINNLIDNYYKDANLIGTLPNEFDYLKDKDVVKAEEEDDWIQWKESNTKGVC